MSALKQWLGSVLFTLYLFFSLPPYAFLVVITAPFFTRSKSMRIAVAWVESVFYMLDLLCSLNYSVEGEQHLQGENTVILMKHSSAWETLAQFKLFPEQTWVLKRELMWAPFLGWANFDNVYSPLETSNAIITGRTRRQSTRMAGLFHDPYLQKIHDTPGGFQAYEKQHLQAVTAMFEPKFPQLPKEVVRYLMTFCFHLGFYVFALAPEVDSDSPSDSDSTYESD